jgi:hypothetical protein
MFLKDILLTIEIVVRAGNQAQDKDWLLDMSKTKDKGTDFPPVLECFLLRVMLLRSGVVPRPFIVFPFCLSHWIRLQNPCRMRLQGKSSKKERRRTSEGQG